MTPPGNGRDRFRIELTAPIAQRIEQLHRIASEKGQAEAFRQALRSLMDRLETAPLTCGEPAYPLRHFGLMVRKIALAPVVIYFTAHPLRRVVWLSSVQLL
jgi:hypothetical protein